MLTHLSSQVGYNSANGGADVAGGAGGPAGGAGGMSPQKRTTMRRPVARSYAASHPAGRRALARGGMRTEGDQRHLFGQGRPMAKDSSGSGSAWATGTVSRYTGASGYNVESRMMFEGTVTATDMSRATEAREKDRIGIFGTGLSYAGSYGRVTSESIGRDLNPLGRGNGQALVGGMVNMLLYSPILPYSIIPCSYGNSINNNNSSWLPGCKSCCGTPIGICPVASLNSCMCNYYNKLYLDHCCGENADWCFEDCVSTQCKYQNCLPDHCPISVRDPLWGCGYIPDKISMNRDCACNISAGILSGIDLPITGHSGCQSNIIWGSSCRYINPAVRDRIMRIWSTAVHKMLVCNGKGCLPIDVKGCFEQLCSGGLYVYVECNGLLCYKPGTGGYWDGNLMTICPLLRNYDDRVIRWVIEHELLHLCDGLSGRRGNHKAPSELCSIPAGVGTNPFNEGFAEACHRACSDSAGTVFDKLPRVNSTMNDCCRCRVCAQ